MANIWYLRTLETHPAYAEREKVILPTRQNKRKESSVRVPALDIIRTLVSPRVVRAPEARQRVSVIYNASVHASGESTRNRKI